MDAGLEIVADILEDRGDLRAKQDQRANDDDGDERDDERVLHETLAAVAAEQTIEHVEVPLSQTYMKQMYATRRRRENPPPH